MTVIGFGLVVFGVCLTAHGKFDSAPGEEYFGQLLVALGAGILVGMGALELIR